MPKPSVIHTQLTDARIAKLNNHTPINEVFVRDTNLRGFDLRISPKNVKSFFVEATVRGRFVRRVIGHHPFITVEDARNRALEAVTRGVHIAN